MVGLAPTSTASSSTAAAGAVPLAAFLGFFDDSDNSDVSVDPNVSAVVAERFRSGISGCSQEKILPSRLFVFRYDTARARTRQLGHILHH